MLKEAQRWKLGVMSGVTGLGVLLQQRVGARLCYPLSSSSNVFASWRSAVSKPSVNQS
jgi:hypothetical protein